MAIIFFIVSGVILVLSLVWVRSRQRRKYVIHVKIDQCRGCKRCVRRCRHHVLEVLGKKENHPYTVVKNPSQCTACKHCIAECRFNALTLVKRDE